MDAMPISSSNQRLGGCRNFVSTSRLCTWSAAKGASGSSWNPTLGASSKKDIFGGVACGGSYENWSSPSEERSPKAKTPRDILRIGSGMANPSEVDVLLAKAISAHQSGHLQNAQAQYRAALKIAPNHPVALHFL